MSIATLQKKELLVLTSVCMVTLVAEPVLIGIPKICEHDFLCDIRYYHREYHCHLRYTDIIPYGYPTYLLGGCSYKNSYVATEITVHT